MPVRQIRRLRTKKKLNYNLPTVVVFRSNKHILAQLMEPGSKKILFTASSDNLKKGTKSEKATEVGKEAAKQIKKLKYDRVLFDRNGFVYHGRVKALAEAIREENISM
jgi:large subunit ribosomal protein L18